MGLFDWDNDGDFDMFDAFVTRHFYRKLEKKQERALRRQELFDYMFSSNTYQKSNVKFKPSKGFIYIVTVLLIMLAIVIAYGLITRYLWN